MIRRFLLSAVMGVMLVGGASAADVFVRIGPPRPVIERRVPPPGPGYVWTPGYHRWDGRAYGWVPGAWVMPPRRHARWAPARWQHRREGWVMVEGRWR
jgi:hypothetical protein